MDAESYVNDACIDGDAGLKIRTQGKHCLVAGLIPGGAAEKSGLVLLHDVIEKINHQAVSTLSVTQIQDKLKGPIGSMVVISLLRGLQIGSVTRGRSIIARLARMPIANDSRMVASEHSSSVHTPRLSEQTPPLKTETGRKDVSPEVRSAETERGTSAEQSQPSLKQFAAPMLNVILANREAAAPIKWDPLQHLEAKVKHMHW